jgi:predicted component of type VI protein secretion system
MPTLTIQLPGLPPVAHVLNDETSTIGRMKGNTIVIDDSSVSLSHAKITRKNGEFFLKDLNSTNGTEVNGQPINEARLRDCDRVRFANISAQFLLVETAAANVPLPVAPAPLLSAISSQTASPLPANGPASRPAAAPAPDCAMPAPTPPAPNLRPARHFLPVLSACVGGATGLIGVAFLVWRLVHAEQIGPSTPMVRVPLPSPGTPMLAGTLPAATAAKPAAEPRSGSQTGTSAETSDQSVPQLIRSLNAPDAAERRRAASTLHALGADAADAVPALRAALADTDQEVRMWSALTLINEKSYDKASIPVLVEVLQHPNPVLRQLACLSLGLLPYEGAEKEMVIPPLTETVRKDSDEEVRKAAVSALNIIAPEALVQSSVKQNN